jgi:type I restriction-modification system DNA methylase subunit
MYLEGGNRLPAPAELHELVERYYRNRKQYSSLEYKEAELRKEFIDPLFEMLGWDVSNKQGLAEQYKEVVHEPSQEVAGGTKAPDYAFRIAYVTKFFVEAKKASVDIGRHQLPAFQLRRYAWSKKLPLSILTNFEDFAVYDGRFKPNKWDKPTAARVMHVSFQELEERWDELFAVFSPNAIRKGLFDRYAQEEGKKHGTSEVDDEFLKDIEEWREALAKNIALRNANLTIEELNFSVQRLIDRIVFLRICEDRGTEPIDQLKSTIEKGDIYDRLIGFFQQADAKYNSGLFHFQKDANRKMPPDLLAPKLTVEDKILKEIIRKLYYPDSPYQFDVISADILGQVYEQFLGKVIRLTEGHRAKVEEKPEIKKAGGVYYTPTYIVNYIVENTVGKLCKGESPTEMEKLSILDPACGSGSFLIVAYSRLLKEHLDWYTDNDPTRWKDAVFQGSKGEWRLTLLEKKRILLNNIYGVDIDSQAVEVTKLNLLLKALEGESKESVENVMKWFREPALPDLANNIKCGNSLVDFRITCALNELPEKEREEELNRINPFTWEKEFPEIMKAGGFDVVIGNPPYIKIQTMKEWAPLEGDFYKQAYTAASTGNYDIYVVFIEKGLNLLNPDGCMGFIQPHKFFQAKFGEPLRKHLSGKKAITEIVHFGAEQIFAGPTTYTCLLFLSQIPQEGMRFVSVKKMANPATLLSAIQTHTPHPEYEEAILPQPSQDEWSFSTGGTDVVLRKLRQQPQTLGDITRKIFVGLQTSADRVYVLKTVERRDQTVICSSKSLGREVEIEKGLVKPFLMGKDVHRYEPPEPENVVIFPYTIEEGRASLMSQDFIQKRFPKGWQYLVDNKDELAGREKGKMKGSSFYAYIYPKNLAEFEAIKVMTPDICQGSQLTIDESATLYHTTTIYSFIFKEGTIEDAKYFLGVLNSKLLWFFLQSTGTVLRGGFVRFKTEYLKPFPIRTIDFSDSADKARHGKTVRLVERMLKLHLEMEKANTPSAQTRIQRQIEATDKEINALVCELYDLTEEEIKIVDG